MKQPSSGRKTQKAATPSKGRLPFLFVERTPDLSRNFFKKVCLFDPNFRNKDRGENSTPKSEEARSMSLEQDKQHAFDAFCKRVVKNEAASVHREYKQQYQDEVVFSDLNDKEMQQLQYTDRYAPDRQTFPLLGMKVEILDSDLAMALSALSPERRSIIMLSYLLDMTDAEIAHLLKLSRTTLRYRRRSSLKQLRKIMEGFEHE